MFALSLSDQYWLNPAEQPLEWRKVNFYHNDFSEDVGNILFGQIPERDSIDLVSPLQHLRRLVEEKMEDTERPARTGKRRQRHGATGTVQ